MPYQLKIDGMAEISRKLELLEEKAPAVAAQALYEGAAVMQQAILQEMNAIKTAEFKYAKSGTQRLPSPEEKAVLEQAGVGVAKFDKNGAEIDTSVGFNVAGYAKVNFRHMRSKARTNYKGDGTNVKPVGVIANSINSGTSFMKKQPFVRKGMTKGAPKAMQVMQEKIEQAFEAITKE